MYELITNGNVSVKSIVTHDDRETPSRHAEITVDGREGQYIHRFPHTSRVSKALDVMRPEALAERLSGGSYFFIEEDLIDFRDGSYNGFVHTDENLGKLMEVIGFTRQARGEEKVMLLKAWDNFPFEIPEFQQAKNYHFALLYKWSPFVKTVGAVLKLVRLICGNDLYANTNGIINTKIPLFNRWQEHLDIASKQIETQMVDITRDRLLMMKDERASVAECALVEKHAYTRLISETVNPAVRENLQLIIGRVSPMINLTEVYRPSVFKDKNLCAQLPSHLTSLDLFNVATEMRTHTSQEAQSTNRALDKFSGDLLYESHKDINNNLVRFGNVNLSSFSDPTRAFFGTL